MGLRLFSLILMALSGLAGWVLSSTQPVHAGAKSVTWPDVRTSDNAAEIIAAQQIIESARIFPMNKVAKRVTPSDRNLAASAAREGVPNFPLRSGYTTVNGVSKVLLKQADGKIVLMGAGDQLDTGWLIKNVKTNKVLAVFDGKEQGFSISDTNQAQEVNLDRVTSELNTQTLKKRN